ncbi:MAG: hypothetical protein V5B44_15995 [Candidatus Accumulibacter necessarius]|jgi:hypothetical protein|uniref:hypothetical protein n=1 Tax=Candidatus Accumulibacter necessarius TaxID=2954386 RepID=UPI002FC2C4B1
MSEFKLNCEYFLATTRQHFFASDLAAAAQQGDPADDFSGAPGEAAHHAHAGT